MTPALKTYFDMLSSKTEISGGKSLSFFAETHQLTNEEFPLRFCPLIYTQFTSWHGYGLVRLETHEELCFQAVHVVKSMRAFVSGLPSRNWPLI